MELGMTTLKPSSIIKLPSLTGRTQNDSVFRQYLLFSPKVAKYQNPYQRKKHRCLVVEAKAKKGTASRQFQRSSTPPLPKIEDDGNPKFVIFIRTADVYIWYPLNIVNGGSSAKIIVSAKDTFIGKYIYKDTLARNLGAVIYRDEKEMQKMAKKQFRVLRSATEFKYGYKLVENNNLRAAVAANDVIELPTRDELKTVFDKVKDFFGETKESFGKMTVLNSETESTEENSTKKSTEI